MANISLGIYIDDGLIKYAKVKKEKDKLKIEAFNVVFYDNLQKELKRVINETGSSKIPICINLSNEIYNKFNILASASKKDRKDLIKNKFEKFCNENELNANLFDSRFLIKQSDSNEKMLSTITISAEKKDILNLENMFVEEKIESLKPISTSIVNLIDVPKDDNCVIVNIENQTIVTTIIDREINNINTLNIGMQEILNSITKTENSIRKSYEVCKNTTIDAQEIYTEGNEHLGEILPILYDIAQGINSIVSVSAKPIKKVYITGLGSSINNIDLYFQEYINTCTCEILKPYFLENVHTNVSIKEYIEVNSAVALALDGIDECCFEKTSNFERNKEKVVNSKKTNENNKKIKPKHKMDYTEKILSRVSSILCMTIIVYVVFTQIILMRIDNMKEDAENEIISVDKEIKKAESDLSIIKSQADYYEKSSKALKNIFEGNDAALSESSKLPNQAIPNMLNSISNVIPKDIMLISVKNTKNTHIVLEAVAPNYDELGYFKGILSTDSILKNVKASSGQKVTGNKVEGQEQPEEWVYVTIEGDL